LLVLVIVVLSTAGTYLYYDAQPEEYKASTRLFLKTSELEQAFSGEGATGDPVRNANNLATLLRSRAVAVDVAKRLDYRGEPTALLDRVDASPVVDSDFVNVSATSGSADGAARLANAFARAFVAMRSAQARAQVRSARRTAQRQRAQLTPGSPAYIGLTGRIDRYRSIESLPAANVQQLDRAVPPATASSPRPKRNAAFGFAVSLVFAMAVALALERFDHRLRRLDDLESHFPYPFLAAIPHVSESDSFGMPDAEEGAFRETFRTLRTSLELASLDRPLRTILIASGAPQEGKSTIVRHLALAYREAGYRVAVVEADLRKPALAELFLIKKRPGLTDVLTGHEHIDRALQPVSAEGGPTTVVRQRRATTVSPNGGSSSAGTLHVLTSGPQPPNPPRVLAADRLRRLLEEVSDTHDVVLIDSAPLLAVGDTLPLLRIVDGTILVARPQVITRESARQLNALLGRVGDTNVLGMVANDLPMRELEGRVAFYGYGPSS
jgi:Mrp family chromosome partitioning ATPase/capsular polysaccharide biosynthesis protein